MKKLASYIAQHVREDFNLLFYLFVAMFLVVTFYFNFFHGDAQPGFTWEDRYLNMHVRDQAAYGLILFKFLGFYALPYYTTFLVYTLIYKKTALLARPQFWIRSFFILCVLAVNGGFFAHREAIREFTPQELVYWIDYTAANAGSMLFFLVPIVLFKVVMDRRRDMAGLYGLTRKNFTPGPYLLILLIMLPVVFGASTTLFNHLFGADSQATFLTTYPTYKAHLSAAEEYLGVSDWVTTAFYEVFYISDFIFVELLFRGFMVIGLASVIGRGAIMPMVTTYAFLHFGKPLGEAVGSIFGGYILGIIAYSSRNIWGGALVHGGIALMMELSAIFQIMIMKVTPGR